MSEWYITALFHANVCVCMCVSLVPDWKPQQVGKQHFREACTLLIIIWISHIVGWHLCSCVTLVRGNKDKNWMLLALFITWLVVARSELTKKSGPRM